MNLIDLDIDGNEETKDNIGGSFSSITVKDNLELCIARC